MNEGPLISESGDEKEKTKKIKVISIIIFTIFLLVAVGLVLLFVVFKKHKEAYPFLDPSLPLSSRIDDLLSRLTIEEKASQMINSASAIPRLGIPKYNWWNEGLHGVARAGIATVFPQAIGLAATWNEELIFQTADIISTEFRAKYNNETNTSSSGEIYHGLTVWSPFVNIFRDPRWGRGQETFGEDPELSGRLGVAFVKGLQGNNSHYFKTIATPKVIAVHSGPETGRASFDTKSDEIDLVETELPAFRASIIEGKAFSIMGAENKYNGVPCCVNELLLGSFLRKSWNFSGEVVSDCGAIGNIYEYHHEVDSPEKASSLAVTIGTDLECGEFYLNLPKALNQSLIKEKTIDKALGRLIEARMRLGMFDPPEIVEFSKINITQNDSPDHREEAKKVARESIVLLKNKDSLLPLLKNISSVAILGPNANASDVMFGNERGEPSSETTPLQGIENKIPTAKIAYSLGCTHVDYYEILKNISTDFLLSKNGSNGLDGYYFNNGNLSGDPLQIKLDKSFNFVFNSTISVRWNGTLAMKNTGDYVFALAANDGIRLFIDNILLIDNWKNRTLRTNATKILNLKGNVNYSITIEEFHYQTHAENGTIKFQFSDEPYVEWNKAIELSKGADYILFFGGISPMLEGEEGDVDVEIPGFFGGDRTSIELPEIQTKLIKKLSEEGKPIILILMSGSSFSINWESSEIPAILQAWEPGEEGGSAIADIIFGDENPSGKLPISFYPDLSKIPEFTNYSMERRTERYEPENLLYEFGFGLSETKFGYDNLTIDGVVKTNESLNVSVIAVNQGEFDGLEVVQLYITFLSNRGIKLPRWTLQGFKKVNILKGEKMKINFVLNSRQLSFIIDKNKRVVVSGTIVIYVGGRMPTKESIDKGLVLKAVATIVGEDYLIEDEIS